MRRGIIINRYWQAAAAGAIAAPIIGGMIGRGASAGDKNKQEEMMRAALAEISSIQIPEERMMKLEELKSAGVLTPEMEQSILQQDTELQNIALDPGMRAAQMDALSKMQEIGEGGFTLSDKARMNKMLGESKAAETGMREAGLQDLRRRGMGGGGMDLAATLASSQAGADRASNEALNIEAMAQDRALQGILGAGDMAGNLRQQDYGEQAKAAEAQDIINRFNVANRGDVQGRNVASRNMAQAGNLQNRQDIMNQNVGLRNQANMYNMQAPQRQFENHMMKGGAMAGQQGNMANMYGQRAQDTQQMWGGIGQGVGQGMGSYGMYKAGQQSR